ncbi:glycine cleavage system protein T [Thermococcus chitonophagus]|uniref:Probable aminomethyltransferase n=1 Tax=Thermococcus chitonophagus TaxID=54262 RepID=A0A160VT33_9EURY|nr:glycine cleavage system aminomethyltransferase GcvT [Thermococcus chitonophagus]ASJ16764.1 glycine cleavage system protein T [Thermococcus chitonophagus]CUX78235.1 Aminomethyltransferase (glycine cleavage system T protein) [Thermococcus chitonophagus]
MAKRVHLFDWHKEHAKKIEEFAGWEMPIWYSSIKEEHLAVRNAVGVFDVSHMGEIVFRGKDALKFLQYVTTNDVSKPPAISGTYTLVLNERGAIKDETLVFNMGNDEYFMVCDADAFEKLYAWFTYLKRTIEQFTKLDLEIELKTYDIAMFAVQGPKARDLAQDLFGIDINEMWWFQARWVELDGVKMLLSRSGYTGENGFEVYIEDANPYHPDESKRGEPEKALHVWERILEEGKKYGIKPAGLGARDTLRLEAGYTLYGNETKELQLLSTDIDEVTPLQANLEFAIYWDKDFIGKDALLKQKERGLGRKLVHFKMVDKGIPREGYKVYANGELIGEVTSGTLSPLLGIGIGIAFVKEEYAKPGIEIEVDIRGQRKKAVTVTPPFYDPKKYGLFRET